VTTLSHHRKKKKSERSARPLGALFERFLYRGSTDWTPNVVAKENGRSFGVKQRYREQQIQRESERKEACR